MAWLKGKGSSICATKVEAQEAVRSMLGDQRFGEAGARVVLEEFLEGEELTVMAFADGRTVIPMIPAQDHKRIGEGDTGPNTGGMGAYAPAPLATPELQRRISRRRIVSCGHGLIQSRESVLWSALCRPHDQRWQTLYARI